jgi:hypothetical protein
VKVTLTLRLPTTSTPSKLWVRSCPDARFVIKKRVDQQAKASYSRGENIGVKKGGEGDTHTAVADDFHTQQALGIICFYLILN